MLYFIVNPNSGGAKGYLVWKKAELRLQKLKVDYKVFLTTGPGDAMEFARQITGGDDEDIVLVHVAAVTVSVLSATDPTWQQVRPYR